LEGVLNSNIRSLLNGISIPEYYKNRENPRFFLTTADLPIIVQRAREVEPEICTRTIALADEASNGTVPVIGLGQVDLGNPIDWHKRLPEGECWPTDKPGIEIDYLDIDSPQPCDVRLTWEFNRCHHFVTLAQACCFTQDPKYFFAFKRQLKTWSVSNPYPLGVNWAVSMEVAIRSVNWIWAFCLFQSCNEMDASFIRFFLRQLHMHAEFIERYLENGRIPGNHYLSNGVGLTYIGLLFPEFKFARRWLRKGLRILWSQIPKQFYQDGGNFEGSIGYHRLGVDLCLSCLLLCRVNGIAIPRESYERIQKAVDFIKAYLYQDGTAPNFGDNDDGRLLRLAPREANNHRSIMGCAAATLDNPDLSASAGDQLSEAVWMGWRPNAANTVEHEPASKAFPQSGIYHLLNRTFHIAVDAGSVGMFGRGPHAHNDTLSFELVASGRKIIIDSGTYLYTASLEQRNVFRGTAAHNIVFVDEKEMADWESPTGLWGIRDQAKPKVMAWHDDQDFTILKARHEGYKRLPRPVMSYRLFILDKREDRLAIRDSFEGVGYHSYRLYLHLAPGIIPEVHGRMISLRVENSADRLLSIVSFGETISSVRVLEREVSIVYGSKTRVQVLMFSWEGKGSVSHDLAFVSKNG